MSVSLEVGKYYMSRGNGQAGPIEKNPDYPQNSQYEYRGRVQGSWETWTGSGEWNMGSISDWDLLHEVKFVAGGVVAPKSATPSPQALTIQAGRYYETRGGVTVGPIVANSGSNGNFPWSVTGGPLGSQTWDAKGFWFGAASPDPKDLVREVPAPGAGANPVLQIAAGRHYMTRGQGPVGPIVSNPGNGAYPWTVAGGPLAGTTWDTSGRVYSGGSASGRDLVSEIVGQSAAIPGGAIVASKLRVSQLQSTTLVSGAPVLQVSAGGWYRRRDGVVVGPLLRNPSSPSHPLMADPVGAPRTYYTAEGAVSRSSPSDYDLVEAVDGPDPAAAPEKETVPIDQVKIGQYQRGVAAIWDTFRLLP